MTTVSPREEELYGIGVSPGIVQGEVHLVGRRNQEVPRYRISPDEVEAEVERFQRALGEAREEHARLLRRLGPVLRKEHLGILDAHHLLLGDEMLIQAAVEHVRQDCWNAEWALQMAVDRFKGIFEAMGHEYLRERQGDLHQVSEHLLSHLLGTARAGSPLAQRPMVLVAHELTPAELLDLHQGPLLGFVTDLGGKTSHTAILAGALDIPAVLGLREITQRVQTGDAILLDGETGRVVLHPLEETVRESESSRLRYIQHQEALQRLRALACVTSDGVRCALRANVELAEEVAAVQAYGAEGVGLYRTEYLFLNRPDLPGEEEHFQAYRRLAESVLPHPAVIRTFDLGGDIFPASLGLPHEQNPALGLRAIRLSLEQRDLFLPQLRGILRASAFGKLQLMYPLISGVEEVRRANALLEEVKEGLRAEGVDFDGELPVGVMIETPSAAILADVLAQEVDFFSIGTNDLSQYTLALDRGNEEASSFYEPFHPAVLRLIRSVVAQAEKSGIRVALCGEMAADPLQALILIGLGLRDLSMTPRSIPRVKQILRSISLVQAEEMAQKALGLATADELRALRAWVREDLAPQFPDQLPLDLSTLSAPV